MPQPLGIKEIKSKLLSPALTSLYYVQIPLPSTGPLDLGYFNRKWCANRPGQIKFDVLRNCVAWI